MTRPFGPCSMPAISAHIFTNRPRASAMALMVVGVLLSLGGCLSEAPHSNPLDPNSDEYEEEGSLEGRTTRFYPPHAPVENAEIRLTPGPYVASSGPDGTFSFEGIPVGSYTIEAVKDGFAAAADTVKVSLGKRTTGVQLRLNGMPAVRTFDLRTIHISRWWPQEDLFLLEVTADLEDPDGVGDVSSVWMEVPAYEFAHPLEQTSVVGRYQLLLPAASLPTPSLHSLQGSDIVVHADDDAGVTAQSAPQTIVRVIDDTPLAEEPQGLATVDDGMPTLVWQDAALPFDHTYRVDIVRDQANVQTVVATITDVSSETTTYQVESPLPQGTYFWTVSVVDTFGNRSRSKEAGFVVP